MLLRVDARFRHNRSDTKINIIMAYVINTGLLTSMCAICCFVTVSSLHTFSYFVETIDAQCYYISLRQCLIHLFISASTSPFRSVSSACSVKLMRLLLCFFPQFTLTPCSLLSTHGNGCATPSTQHTGTVTISKVWRVRLGHLLCINCRRRVWPKLRAVCRICRWVMCRVLWMRERERRQGKRSKRRVFFIFLNLSVYRYQWYWQVWDRIRTYMTHMFPQGWIWDSIDRCQWESTQLHMLMMDRTESLWALTSALLITMSEIEIGILQEYTACSV